VDPAATVGPDELMRSMESPMRLVLIGAFLILLPAIVVVFYYWGSVMMIPAVASLFVASLPFFGFALVVPKSDGDEESQHGSTDDAGFL
jgi:hypothetical protein